MQHIVIGTAGHIDHGKSALVRALTGLDPDRLKEEKERGITIDLGFAHYERGETTFAFVDVPGHERFVRNMLAGASGIDLVLLVVAADESVMPQTREHFDICRLLHVSGGLIALTKADLVDSDTVELVQLETRELVAGSFLEAAPIVAVSSKTGEGLDTLRAALDDLVARVPRRGMRGAARLPIDRVFSVRGFGTVITGTLVSGRVGLDDGLLALPEGRPVKVRGLQVHGQRLPEAFAGQRTAVNLGGVEVAQLRRGDVLVAPGTMEPSGRIDASFELLPGARPLRHGARVRFHQGTNEVLGRVALTTGSPELSTETSGLALRPGSRTAIRLRLERPAVVTRGDRFILRAYSPPVTIGGGQVLDPNPPRVGLRTQAARTRFERLDLRDRSAEAAPEDAVVLMVEELGVSGLPLVGLTRRLGVPPDAVGPLVERLEQSGRISRAGDTLLAAKTLVDLRARLLKMVGEYHAAQPLSEGLPREEARERLFGQASPAAAVFDYVVDAMVQAQEIVARDRLALSTHRVSLSGSETQARDAIVAAFVRGGLRPPDGALLASSLGLPPELVDRMVALMVRQGVLVRLGSLLFSAEALDRLKAEMRGLKTAQEGVGAVDVAVFKERYGVTRKFAIPLLEYLDRERITRRVGDRRILV